MGIKCERCYGTIVNGVCQSCKATYAVAVDADKKNMLIDKMLEIAKMQYESAGPTAEFYEEYGIYFDKSVSNELTVYIPDGVKRTKARIGDQMDDDSWWNVKVVGGRDLVSAAGLFSRVENIRPRYKSLDLSLFCTSSITNLDYMFRGCSFKTLDLSTLDLSMVETMVGFMSRADANILIIDNDLSNLGYANEAFKEARFTKAFIYIHGAKKVISLKDFLNASSIIELDIESDKMLVHDASGLFQHAEIPKFKNKLNLCTEDITSLFNRMTTDTNIDMSFIDPETLKHMDYAFSNCESKMIDMSVFNESLPNGSVGVYGYVTDQGAYEDYFGKIKTKNKCVIASALNDGVLKKNIITE